MYKDISTERELINSWAGVAVKIRVATNLILVRMYTIPQESDSSLKKALKQSHMHNGEDTIIIEGLNAINITWDRLINGRGTAVASFAKTRNYKFTPPKEPSFFGKGKKGSSKPELIF